MTPAEELTAADWRQRLETSRPATVRADDESHAAELRRTFRDLTLRTRTVHRSPWVTQPDLAVVRRRLQHALSLSQLVAEELQQPERTALDTIRELLAANNRLLDGIERQLLLLDFVHEAAEQLHPLADQIVYGVETTAQRLLHLADESAAAIGSQPLPPALTPWDATAVAASLKSVGWPRAEWFTQALLSARLITSVSPAVLHIDRDVRRLTVAAALMQDIGCWHIPHHLRQSPSVRGGRRRPDPNHPSAGAAILDGLLDAPALLCLLVGAHHERQDGTGFPQRLAGRNLSRIAQWLGLIVRFVELLSDPLSGELSADLGRGLDFAAGLRLWRDVRRGAFDEPLAIGLLDSLHSGLSAAVAEQYVQHQRRLVDHRHSVPAPRRWPQPESGTGRTDNDDDNVVGAPAFFRRQRDGRRRSARIPPQDSR